MLFASIMLPRVHPVIYGAPGLSMVHHLFLYRVVMAMEATTADIYNRVRTQIPKNRCSSNIRVNVQHLQAKPARMKNW